MTAQIQTVNHAAAAAQHPQHFLGGDSEDVWAYPASQDRLWWQMTTRRRAHTKAGSLQAVLSGIACQPSGSLSCSGPLDQAFRLQRPRL